MHLLIILLQQLLGMLPSKKVPQPEVVRSGNPASGSATAGPEPDAFARLRPLTSWMTPCLNVLRFALSARPWPCADRWHSRVDGWHLALTLVRLLRIGQCAHLAPPLRGCVPARHGRLSAGR